jgi:hypothetical protein
MLAEAKELYASTEARANGTIKQVEELAMRVRAIEEREQAVDELEQKLQEREALDDLRLERELAGLATHESSLKSREAALAAEQKDFEDVCASVLAHELVANVRENALDTRATEVADRERWLAEQQMQELAAAQKGWRTSKLSVWARRRKSVIFWAGLSLHLCPLVSAPFGSRSWRKKLMLSSHCLILLVPKCQSWKMSSPAGWRRTVASWQRQLRSTCCCPSATMTPRFS